MLKNPRSLLLTFLQWKAVKVNENFTFNDWQEMCLLFNLILKLSNWMSKVMSRIHLHSTEQKWPATKWDWLLIIHCQWSSQKKIQNWKIIYLSCWSTIWWILSNWFPKIMDEMFQMSKTSGWLPWMFHPSNFVISATILKNARDHYGNINVAIIKLKIVAKACSKSIK